MQVGFFYLWFRIVLLIKLFNKNKQTICLMSIKVKTLSIKVKTLSIKVKTYYLVR